MLKNSRAIALMKTIMEIDPDLRSSIEIEETISNLTSNNIEKPRNYRAIIASPSVKQEIVGCCTRNVAIDKSELVFCQEGHEHSSTLGVVIGSGEMMRNQSKPWMISIMKKVRATRVCHGRIGSVDNHTVVLVILSTASHQKERM